MLLALKKGSPTPANHAEARRNKVRSLAAWRDPDKLQGRKVREPHRRWPAGVSAAHAPGGAVDDALRGLELQQRRDKPKTLDFRCTPELQAFLERLDAWAGIYMAENNERLFKGKLPEYRDCLQRKAGYRPR